MNKNIEKTEKIIDENDIDGEFTIGRSGNSGGRRIFKGYECVKNITRKVSCKKANKEENILSEHFIDDPKFEGVGDGRGNCPEDGKQNVYIAWNKKK